MTTLLLQPPAPQSGRAAAGAGDPLCPSARQRGSRLKRSTAIWKPTCFSLRTDRLKDRCADSSDTAPAPGTQASRRIAGRPCVPRRGTNFARYNTAVRYLNRLLALWNTADEKLTLGDYQHSSLSPFAPEDLERIASGNQPDPVCRLFHHQAGAADRSDQPRADRHLDQLPASSPPSLWSWPACCVVPCRTPP